MCSCSWQDRVLISLVLGEVHYSGSIRMMLASEACHMPCMPAQSRQPSTVLPTASMACEDSPKSWFRLTAAATRSFSCAGH